MGMYGIGYEKSDVKSKRIGSGFKSLTSDPLFKEKQEIFEHNLGKYAFKNEKAKDAVTKGLTKMQQVLVKYYARYNHSENAILQNAFTTQNDPTSAGQVGKIAPEEIKKIIGGDSSTNLREQMTAFYNAAYYNGYSSDNPTMFFNLKNIVQNDIAIGKKSKKEKKSLVNHLGLGTSVLDECKYTSRNPFSKNPLKSGISSLYNTGIAHGLMKFWGSFRRMFNKDYDKDKQFSKRMHRRDVLDMGLISLNSGSLTQAIHNIKSGSSLRYREVSEQDHLQHLLTYYNDNNLNLSQREAAYLKSIVKQDYINKQQLILNKYIGVNASQDDIEETNNLLKNIGTRYLAYDTLIDKSLGIQNNEVNIKEFLGNDDILIEQYDSFSSDTSLLSEEVENTRSPIKEGIIYKDIREGSFLQKDIADKHNIRVVNGISMTTARMLKCFKWLGFSGDDLLNFRLALMGWMLPTDDHSLWEIIIGSHNVGVKGSEDLTDVVSMDQTVSPLTADELRNSVCEKYEILGHKELLFPHEIVYWNKINLEDAENDYNKSNIITVFNDSKVNRNKEKIDNLEIFKALVLDPKRKSSFISEQNRRYLENSFKNSFAFLDMLSNVDKDNPELLDVDNLFNKNDDDIYKEIDTIYSSAKKTKNRIYYETEWTALELLTLLPRLYDLDELSFRKNFNVNIEDNIEDTIKTIIESNDINTSIKNFFEDLEPKITENYNILKDFCGTIKNHHIVEELPIFNYTTSAYASINNLMKMELSNELFTKLYLKNSIYKDSKKSLKDQGVNPTKENLNKYKGDLYFETNMLLKSLTYLKNNNKPYIGHVYSGTWVSKIFSNYKKGNTVTFDMFTSTTKNPQKAKGFIGGKDGATVGSNKYFLNNVLLDIELKGINGVDISNSKDFKCLSVFPSEQEVLCLPGTKIKITDVQKNVNLTSYINRKKPLDDPDDYENEKQQYGVLVKAEEIE